MEILLVAISVYKSKDKGWSKRHIHTYLTAPQCVNYLLCNVPQHYTPQTVHQVVKCDSGEILSDVPVALSSKLTDFYVGRITILNNSCNTIIIS